MEFINKTHIHMYCFKWLDRNTQDTYFKAIKKFTTIIQGPYLLHQHWCPNLDSFIYQNMMLHFHHCFKSDILHLCKDFALSCSTWDHIFCADKLPIFPIAFAEFRMHTEELAFILEFVPSSNYSLIKVMFGIYPFQCPAVCWWRYHVRSFILTTCS